MSDGQNTFTSIFLQTSLSILVQSTLLLAIGMTLAMLLRRGGPALRAFVLQITLASVMLGSILSVFLSGHVQPVWNVALPTIDAATPAATSPLYAQSSNIVRITAQGGSPASVNGQGSLRVPVNGGVGGGFVDAGPGGQEMGKGRGSSPSDIRTDFTGAVVIAWALGALLLLVRLAFCQWRLLQLRRNAVLVADGPAAEKLTELAASLNVKRPALRASTETNNPFLAGVWKPAVFLPASYAAEYDDETLHVILAHELAHLKRKDLLWTWLLRLTTAILWPQPLLWLLARQLEQATEEACDLLAVSADYPPARYADCLLRLAESVKPSNAERALGAGVVSAKSGIGRRITLILQSPTLQHITRRVRLTALVTVIVVTLAALLSFGASPPAVPVKYFDWAKQQGWTVQPIQQISPDTPKGIAARMTASLRGQTMSSEDIALTAACNDDYHSLLKPGVVASASCPAYDKYRSELLTVLRAHPHFFYAEYLLWSWYCGEGDILRGKVWLDASLHDAPAVLAARLQYRDGRPIPDMPMQINIECDSPGSLNSRGAILQASDNISDHQGCIYIPVFRGIYSEEDISGGGELQSPEYYQTSDIAEDPFVIHSHVGVMPSPLIEMPLMSLKAPFNNPAYERKAVLISGTTLHLAWQPYRGAATYRVFIDEAGGQDFSPLLTAGVPYNVHWYNAYRTAGTQFSIPLTGNKIGLSRYSDYQLIVGAFDRNGQVISESTMYLFRPMDATKAYPMSRAAIQAAIGGDAVIFSITRRGGILKVDGTISKSNLNFGSSSAPSFAPGYQALFLTWNIRELPSGIYKFTGTIQPPPHEVYTMNAPFQPYDPGTSRGG